MADALSADQVEKMLQFQDLTGIEDMAACREVLDRNDWELAVSVAEALDGRDEPPAPVATARDIGLFRYIVSLVYGIVYGTLAGIFSVAMRLIRPDPRRMVTDPVGDVTAFVAAFEARFGSVHPTFYLGTYSQALADAKQELRFLIVYLHCWEHQHTEHFCRHTLTHPDVISFLDGGTALFWACDVSAAEGYRVSQALRENGYPFIAVVVLRDHRMTVVARLEGPVEPERLVRRLRSVVADNESALVAARADRVERSLTASLRLAQDAAYEESLAADERKERLRLEAAAARDAQITAQAQLEQQERDRLAALAAAKVESGRRVPAEPDASAPGAVQLVVKLPDGARLERRFLDTHPLQAVWHYVFSQPDAPARFEVAANFPKRVLPIGPENADEEGPATLRDAGLKHREVLFVYDLDA